jgi:hypothetical protein
LFWDIAVTTLLVFVCTITPLHIAFNTKSQGWCIAYVSFDFIFMIDIVVIFFTSLPATDEEDEITDRKVIAASYLRGWFFVDVMAIFPFDLIATSIYQQSLAICSKCSFEEENHS